MATGKFIAYYRVSTVRQGRSQLGLEAQRHAVRSYLDGGRWQLVEEIVEVESGKRSDRPELARALGLCRLHHATLVIAKLDRLARNVEFISNLMNSNVEFVAADMPHANKLTVHILAAMAEHEAEAISVRTKLALAAAKARGRKLGPWKPACCCKGRYQGQRCDTWSIGRCAGARHLGHHSRVACAGARFIALSCRGSQQA